MNGLHTQKNVRRLHKVNFQSLLTSNLIHLYIFFLIWLVIIFKSNDGFFLLGSVGAKMKCSHREEIMGYMRRKDILYGSNLVEQTWLKRWKNVFPYHRNIAVF